MVAGCASHSLYRRKRSTSTQPNGSAPATSSSSSILGGAVQAVREKIGVASLPQQTTPCGVGQWEPVYLGRADYLEKGVERDWSFRDAVYVDGEVIMVSCALASFVAELTGRTTETGYRIRRLTRSRSDWLKAWTSTCGAACLRRTCISRS